MASGKAITLFVNGNAYFGNNIAYASGYDAQHVPKLAIVVKGDIYVDPGVTQLDGLYIAEPTSGFSGGDFWTCHDGTNSTIDGFWVRDNCGSATLTVNGAVIAKQLNLFRYTNGDLAGPAAETFNYTPAMVVGGPFFNPPASANPRIDSLISLPPVF